MCGDARVAGTRGEIRTTRGVGGAGGDALTGIVQLPVAQDVRLDAFEDLELAAVSLVQPVDGTLLGRHFFDLETAGIVSGLRMVRETEIRIATLAGRLCHIFQRVRAVRLRGVRVKDASYVILDDQLWQSVVQGELNFLARLSQFGRDIGQVQGAIDFLFGLPSDHPTFSEQAVRLQRQALAAGDCPQGTQMIFGPCG